MTPKEIESIKVNIWKAWLLLVILGWLYSMAIITRSEKMKDEIIEQIKSEQLKQLK